MFIPFDLSADLTEIIYDLAFRRDQIKMSVIIFKNISNNLSIKQRS